MGIAIPTFPASEALLTRRFAIGEDFQGSFERSLGEPSLNRLGIWSRRYAATRSDQLRRTGRSGKQKRVLGP
ncbi:protein of unknown function [Pararobbsia alpina]